MIAPSILQPDVRFLPPQATSGNIQKAARKEIKKEITPPERGQTRCRYLLHDRVISSLDDIAAIRELDGSKYRLVLIAEGFEGEAELYLKGADYHGVFVKALKTPGFGDHRKAVLQDIEVCTGSSLISEEKGRRLKNTTLSQLGHSDDIRINHDVEEGAYAFDFSNGPYTTIIRGKAKPETLTAYLQYLTQLIERTTSDYDKAKLHDRLVSFSSIKKAIYIGQSDLSDYIFTYT